MDVRDISPVKQIPFNDITASIAGQRDEIMAAIEQCISQADFINGRAVGEFEQEFASYMGVNDVVGASCGTAALHLMLAAYGIGAGDEVIVPAMTFIATAEAVTMCGATPVFADSDGDTFNLSVTSVEARITERTKGILFVYLHGNTAGATAVKELADEKGLAFFEDCAQAHGARLPGGAAAGTIGVASAFSFFPAKNLGAFGDAGALATNDVALAERARRLANHGRLEKYRHLEPGFNYRLDTMQAAILRVRLRALESEVKQRGGKARKYFDALAGLPLKMQAGEGGARHAYHLFTLLTPKRDELQRCLREHGIQTGIHYPLPLHHQPAYKGENAVSLPLSEMIAEQTLSLPFYPLLLDEQIERVADVISGFFSPIVERHD